MKKVIIFTYHFDMDPNFRQHRKNSHKIGNVNPFIKCIHIYSYSSEFPQHGIVAESLFIASEKFSIPNERDSVRHERLEA